MDWELIGGIILVVLIIVVIIGARRNMNHSYTMGRNMFKMSNDNLEKEKHLDSADYNYYDDKGILK